MKAFKRGSFGRLLEEELLLAVEGVPRASKSIAGDAPEAVKECKELGGCEEGEDCFPLSPELKEHPILNPES